MIQLSDHFTYKRLLRFVLAPILMMIFTSVYGVVDGLFVSNFAGKDSFTAVNLIFPFIMVLGAFGFMFGAGGTAVVSKTMGEGDDLLAKKYFTLIVIVTSGVGAILAAIGIAVIRPVAVWLGAQGTVLSLSVLYGRIILGALPFYMLQNLFQSFFITAEKPKMGFVFTIAGGVANMVLDAMFVAWFRWGLVGAAVATAASQVIGGVGPVIYFACKNKSRLHFVKTQWYGKIVLKSCTNGSSELLGNIAMSLVSILYNKQLLKIAGETGVDAFGVMMYVQFVFVAIFIGYCIGVAPIVGYNYGAQNREELQNIFRKSLILISATAAVMLALAEGLAYPIARLFVGYDNEMCEMTVQGMRLYSICFLFAGFNMFASSFFTSLNNGLVSAILSFGRTLVFQLVCIFLLPIWMGLTGIWIATVVAEGLSLVLTIVMFVVNNGKYGYVKIRRAATEG